ncbi:MAG TPA: hypothetical protein ENJ94_00445 [Gammaproteobacteria bacterium]|nr:hypothetical protein [Gammaproteobacteria bacterium]
MWKSLLRLLPGVSGKALDSAEARAESAGLHLRDVLEAHTAWKKRLERLLEEGDEGRIDLVTIADDRICELGRWLHGPGKGAYGRLPEYQEAVDAHAAFHKAAAEVVIEYKSGAHERAVELLRGKFREASNHNQMALVNLFMAGRD